MTITTTTPVSGPVDRMSETGCVCGCGQTAAQASQARFEALFDHTPRIDTRTPADLAAELSAR